MSFLSFVVAILPVFLIGWFIYKKDKIKESSGLLIKLFLSGILSCFPAIILGLILSVFFPETGEMSFVQMIIYVFAVVAFIEEICKWFFLYKISFNHNEFDSLYDMVVYASFVALGFACFENVLYVSSAGLVTGIVRAFSAVPGHVCDGILMGSYLSLSKFNYIKGNVNLSKKYKILSIVIPTIIHGIYDFCLFWGNPLFILIFLFFVISLFVICFKKVGDISENNIKFVYNNNCCSKCGLIVTGNYCSNCGNKNN